MESIVVAIITGVVTLVGVIMSNSKSRVVTEGKIDALAEKVAKHNQLIERTYEPERTYSRGDSRIVGYGVPRWSVAGGSEPVVDVNNVWRDAGELVVDGWLGVQSVTAWQETLGTHADGFVSGQDWADWGHVPNLVAVERTREAYGSQLVATVQKIVGALELDHRKRSLDARAFSLRTCQRARSLNARSVDGLMGPQTVRCLQAWLNARGFGCGEVDGVLGPQTAMAVQRSINKERGRDG